MAYKIAYKTTELDSIDPFDLSDQTEIPAEFLPRTYGEKLIEPIRAGNLIMLSQVREDVNPELENLRESIERTDLINQLDVARMPRNALAEYIDFVNRIWHSDHDIDLMPMSEDGYYYLVIAGHSRLSGILLNEIDRAKRAIDQGYETDPFDAIVYCKVEEAPSPEAILSLQLEENIHRQIPRERQALCIVEAYLYGLENGTWDSAAEFRRQSGGRFSEKALRNALYFAELPSEVRDQVLIGAFPYLGAVELARTYPHYLNYHLFKYFDGRAIDELTEEERALLSKNSLLWLGHEVAFVQSKRLNSTAAQKRFQGLRENWQSIYGTEAGQPPQNPMLLMSDPLADFRLVGDRLRREYRSLVLSLGEQPFQRAARVMEIHAQLFEDDQEFEGELLEATNRYVARLGWMARESA